MKERRDLNDLTIHDVQSISDAPPFSPSSVSPEDLACVLHLVASRGRVFIELMTSDRKLKASREGSNVFSAIVGSVSISRSRDFETFQRSQNVLKGHSWYK